MPIKEVKVLKQNKKDGVVSKTKEFDNEQKSLKSNLIVAQKKLARTSKDSMMRIFWLKEIKRIEQKLEK